MLQLFRSRRVSVPATGDAVEDTCRKLVRELAEAVELVTWSCAIANAIDRGVHLPPSTVIRHLPERPVVYPAVLHGLSPLFLDRDTLLTFTAFYGAANTAIEFTTKALDNDGAGRREAAAAGPVAAWRCAAASATAAIAQAQLLLANVGARYRLPDIDKTCELLAEVARGGILGIDQQRGVRPLRLVESRRFTRYPKNLPALLDHGGAGLAVVIRDVSRGGCGLDVTMLLPKGLPVTVELGDGSQFASVVVWSAPLNAGVEFDSPLSEDEAMFFGERRSH